MSNITRQNTPSWLHLSDDEDVIWVSRPHWITIVVPILFTIVLFVAGLGGTVYLLSESMAETISTEIPQYVQYLPLILTAIGLISGVWIYLRWRYTAYIITTDEIYRKQGIISQNIEHIRIIRIQNTACDQSIIERILSFGDVIIYTAGSGSLDMVINGVPKPKRVDGLLEKQHDNIQEENNQQYQNQVGGEA